MNFPLYIARRYVFAKKSRNAINIISLISIVGISVGTLTFIVVLSVFNGFDVVVKSLFNSFYADIEVVPAEGKTFVVSPDTLQQLTSLKGVLDVSEITEENALVVYGERQTVAAVRGVDDYYDNVTGIDTMIWDGEYKLWDHGTPRAVVGRGIKYMLNMDPNFLETIKLMVPKRTERISLDPNRSLNTRYLMPSGFFAGQPDIEIKYIIVPVEFARKLFDYAPNELSALEIKTDPSINSTRLQKNIQQLLGESLKVKNREQQNELLYKTMRSEKWAIFFILAFILLVASFNVVGTLTMLIIEKKDDIQTLRHLGANMRTIKKSFLTEGLIISFLGAFAGLAIGTVICLLQQHFGIIKLKGGESFVIDAYPVKILLRDIIMVLIAVSAIGFAASWYPIRFITRKYLSTTTPL